MRIVLVCLLAGCSARALDLPEGVGGAGVDLAAPPVRDLGGADDAVFGRDLGHADGGAPTCRTELEVHTSPAEPMMQQGVVVGDFDGDGRLDFATGDYGFGEWGWGFNVTQPGSINLYRGHGDGTFDPPALLRLGLHVYRVLGGDFDEDGRMDLVAYLWSEQPSDDAMLVLVRGQPDGTLVATSLGPITRGWMAVGRIDDDEHLDIAVFGTSATLLVGHGDGTFTRRPMTPENVAGTPLVTFGDFDGDGHTDYADMIGDGVINIHRGAGDGSFTTTGSSSVTGKAGGLQPLQAADLDGDGHADLVASMSTGVYLLRGKGDGTFAAPLPLVDANGQPFSWQQLQRVDDLDGDGRLDLIGLDVGQLLVARQLADGRFAVASFAGQADFDVGVGDFDRDGRKDVLQIADVGWQLFAGRGAGALAPQPLQGSGRIATVRLADLDGDGRPELVASHGAGPAITAMHISAAGVSGEPETLLATTTGGVVCGGDFDGDGRPDVVIGSTADGGWRSITGRGSAALQLPAGSYCMGAGDLDGDGTLDLVIGRGGDNGLSWMRGNGDGSFAPAIDTGLKGIFSLLVADVDGDRRADFVWSDPHLGDVPSPHLEVALGMGDGHFAAPAGAAASNVPVYSADGVVAAADLNEDGRTDLVAIDGIARTVQVLLQNRDGTLAPPVAYALSDWARSLAVGDLDGDGHADVLVSLPAGVGWMRGQGDGTLGALSIVPTAGDVSGQLQLGDLDGDGRLDVVLASHLTSQITVIHNVCR